MSETAPEIEADDEAEGLTVVLTPVQLAAVLDGESIPESDTLGNRLFGGLKLLGGAIELSLGTGLILAPEPTMLTKAGGSVLLVHGSDTAVAGWLELSTGRSVPTLTQRAVTSAALLAGIGPQRAETAGIVVDILVPIAVSAGLGAARAIAVRRGTLRLIDDELRGAHTIRRHLYRGDAALRERMADIVAKGGRVPAAISTFESAEVAGRSISRCIAHHAIAVKHWATAAQPGATRAFVLNLGEDIGRGVLRGSGEVVRMTSVRVVVRKLLEGNRVYYVVTAYPVP